MSAIGAEPVTATAYLRLGNGYRSRARDVLAGLRTNRARLRRFLMFGGVAIVAGISAVAWLMGGRYVSTDDSYIHAAKLMVTTDVSGVVTEVNVTEGQKVQKGDVLFRLDPHQFEIALADSRAALAQAELDVEAMRAEYQRMVREIGAQQAQVALRGITFDRYAALIKENAISKSLYDQARLDFASAQAKLESLQQASAVQLAKLNGDPNLPAEKSPVYLKAKADVDERQRQLDHTIVRAPFDGIVTKVDSLQPGTLLISAMSAFSTTSAVGLISTSDIWIDANLKETDLTYVKEGNPVSVSVDSYPGRTWTGYISSIGAASNTTFSALPSQNTGGNWVKVVQRIPIRVELDIAENDPPLRAGMSTVSNIDTGKRRWSRMLFGD